MIRKFLSVLLLGAVAFLLWTGARWVRQSDDLRATVVFDEATALRRGDPVVHGGDRIGVVESVSPMGEQEAVAVRIEKDQRNALRTDSLLRTARADRRRQLVVDSNFSVGRPVEDRAVIHARDSRVVRMLEEGGAVIAPMARQAREKAAALLPRDAADFDLQLERWSAKLPTWKDEGGEALARHFAEVKKSASRAESSLRSAGRKLEADRLRARADAWIESAKRKIASDE